MKTHLRPTDPRPIRAEPRALARLALAIGTIAVLTMGAAPGAWATIAQIHPSDDAYVEDRYPASNFGGAGSVYVGAENYNERFRP